MKLMLTQLSTKLKLKLKLSLAIIGFYAILLLFPLGYGYATYAVGYVAYAAGFTAYTVKIFRFLNISM